MSTPLAALLRARIRCNGPLTVAQYMAAALGHPEHGYYHSRDPLGTGGDFTTAPEIGQVFGELIGLWLAQCWRGRGQPSRVILLEAGPGRGTLLADALRAIAAVAPGFRAAVELHLLETSPVLRAAQRRTLGGEAITWHDRLRMVPDDAPLYVIANEFFDALPIRQLRRDVTGWRERLVGLDRDGGALAWTVSARQTPLAARLAPTLRDHAAPGAVAELRPEANRLGYALGRRLAARNGVALIIDYGYGVSACGDTLQAARRHAPTAPLARPGDCDLSAHVDFAALARALRRGGAHVAPLLTQGVFLERLGIAARTAALRRRATLEQARTLTAAQYRLTAPSAMGTLFRVLAATAPTAPSPPGVVLD